MHGKNEIAPIQHAHDGETLLVREIFATIQGEGPDSGTPAIFIRLGGCNLRCYFCDTDFDMASSQEISLEAIMARVAREDWSGRFPLVVLSGGEPLRQNIIPLVGALNTAAYCVQVETAGTVCPPGLANRFIKGNIWRNSIVCSPKTPKLHPEIVAMITAYKYVVRRGEVDPHDGLPIMSTQLQGQSARIARPKGTTPVFVQPMDLFEEERRIENNSGYAPTVVGKSYTRENEKLAVEIAQRYGYRLSFQIHKALQLP